MPKALRRRPGKPRVAYLITDSGMGGAEQEVCHLAIAFRRRGWSVAVISMLPLQMPIAGLTADGVDTFSLGMRAGVPDPRGIARLARLLRRLRPDVLHAHMVHANLLARLSRLLVRTPVLVSTIHNEDEGADWRYAAYRLTNRLADVTTAVSRLAAAEASRRGGAPAGTIEVVPNGVDLSPFARDETLRQRTRVELGLEDRFVWLAVGRLTEAKGYPDMIVAFARLLVNHPRAMLLIAGVGSLQNEIRSLARTAGVADAVRLLGLRTDIAALMQAADGFVMTSRWEGLPMVLLEAGASALPIVATDVGGTRDAVLDGTSGIIIPVGDPTAAAGAMASIMEMPPTERRAMGEAGLQHVRGAFDIGVVADRWERLYRGRGSLPE